jgi:hypothetical protein
MWRLTRSCSVAPALAIALAGCRDPAQAPAASGPTQDPPVIAREHRMEFNPLPPTPTVPTVVQIADALAAGFPASARARAREALSLVVAWDLRALSTFPEPRRLADAAYQGLVERLRTLAPEQRLPALEVIVCERESQRVLDGAIGLGVSRWQLEHPGRATGAPWHDLAAPFAALDRAGVIAEAERRVAQLEKLSTHPDPGCREAMRLDLVHARLALSSARTGAFDTSSGPFVDFLRGVGEPVRDLELH